MHARKVVIRPGNHGDERRDDGPHHLGELRAALHRLRVQLALVEVLYLRLVALQARRLSSPESELELAQEALRLEGELASANRELERLGFSVTSLKLRELDPGQN